VRPRALVRWLPVDILTRLKLIRLFYHYTVMAGTNKSYALEMARFRRGFIVGTPEHTKKKSYPGPVAAMACDDGECIFALGGPRITTAWMCEACTARAPCAVTKYFTHAPSPNKISEIKRRAAAAMALRGWKLTRLYHEQRAREAKSAAQE
jgi:hypothetical protein